MANIDIILEPKSGFFVLLDLSGLLGKKFNNFVIENDKTLLQVLYTAGNIKTLPGDAFCYGGKDKLVIRVTVVGEYNNIYEDFLRLKYVISLLK